MTMQDQSTSYDITAVSDAVSKVRSGSRSQKSFRKQVWSLYKRPRNYNFTIQEKMHFLDCLQQYIEVTENRRLDTSSVVMKKKTWELLVSRYNRKFPHGPPRNYAQLKDLYRRMKIHARKVYKQRSRELEPGETPMAADDPTERLIQMMFSVNSLQASSYLDVELNEAGIKTDRESPDFTVSEDVNGDSDSQFAAVAPLESENDDPALIWTSNGEVRLPTDIVVTEMPIYICEPSEDDASDGQVPSSTNKRLTFTNSNSSRDGISSEQLNQEMLTMALKEHKIKMKVHEAALEVLNLQKKKLLKELDKV